MLNALRKGAATWVAKLLFILLVASFAAWGVGDWTSGFRREKLAEIGGREISESEFERAYQTQITMISNQIGRQITTAEARSLGLTQRVVQTLVGSAAVNLHAEQMNLGISDAAVAQSIRGEDGFQQDGKFSAEIFNQVLRANGLTEPMFVEMHRRELIREQIVGAITAAPIAPRTLVDATHHFRNDERVLKYFILPAEAAGTIEAPGEEALKKYYENNKRAFMAPEFRRASVLLLSPEKVKAGIAITDEDAKASYETNKRAYATPERRTIQQLVFKDMAAAREASQKLDGGADFMALGKELGLKETDIDLGQFTRESFADRRVAEAAFQLEKDKPSAPIDGFAPVIARVSEIVPGSQKTFEEVKDQVRDALAASRASDEITKLHDNIEDERAAGSTLAEIGKKLNLDVKEITVSRQGKDREGKPVDLPGQAQEAVKLIFETDVGVETNPVGLGDNIHAFIDIQEITPERQRPIEDVREDVAKAWTEDETRARLTKKADELIAALSKGQSLEDAAASVNASVKTTASLKRAAAEPGLPVSAIAQAFSLEQGAYSSTPTADRKGRAIFQVATVTPAPALDDKGAEALAAELSRGMSNDAMSQYVNGLQTAYGVKISTSAIARLTGQPQQ